MSDDAERNQPASHKRLEDARARGEVAWSADAVAAAAQGGFAVALLVAGGAALAGLGGTLTGLLAGADPLAEAWLGGGGRVLTAELGGAVLLAVAPLLAIPAAVALAAALAQRPGAAAQRLAPKASRLSPTTAIRGRLGGSGLVGFGMGLAKASLTGAVLWSLVAGDVPRLLALAAAPAAAGLAEMLALARDLVVRVALVGVALGAADLAWQHLSFARRMRMTRQETVDEWKESEGDPHVKAQRRARAQAIAQSRMLEDVAGASVVIVNPTHYAVALRWDRAGGGAPVCVAKGVDEMAARIRERAALAGVPLRRDPPTARALHATVEVGAPVPRDSWRAVAAAIRFADRVRARGRR